MSLTIKTKGEKTVNVPREVRAKGAEAIEEYVAKARKPKGKPKPAETETE